MPSSLQSSPIPSPASRRATNCSLSSITEHSFQGITPSPSTGRKCHLCVRYNVLPMSQVAHSHLQQLYFQRGTTKDQLLFLPPAESIQPTSDVPPVSPVSKPVRKRPALICCLRAASVLGQFLRLHRRLSRALRKSCGRNAIPEPW